MPRHEIIELIQRSAVFLAAILGLCARRLFRTGDARSGALSGGPGFPALCRRSGGSIRSAAL